MPVCWGRQDWLGGADRLTVEVTARLEDGLELIEIELERLQMELVGVGEVVLMCLLR